MILFCNFFFLKCLLYYYYYILRFVLYDDGELTYSVDDHYDTIPQAVINLNNVFEITEADAITGNIIIHIGLKMLNFCAMHHIFCSTSIDDDDNVDTIIKLGYLEGCC